MGREGFIREHLTVLCILGLVMGTASALIATASAGDQSWIPGEVSPTLT